MPDGTEPIPDATPEDAAKAAQVRDELAGIQGDPAVNDAGAVGFDEAAKQANFDQYREKQTSERQPAAPLTPEQQRLIDAREQAIEYANRRLDLTGVDGNPLPTDAALQLIRSVQTEATRILLNQLEKKARGEPIDDGVTEQGLLLSLIANEKAYRVAEKQVKQNAADEIARLLHDKNPLTQGEAFKRLFEDVAARDATNRVGFDEAKKEANFAQYREKQTEPKPPPPPPQGPTQG